MLRGLYTGWTGMATEQKRLDIISNNIANAATTGYKQENVTSQAFAQVLTDKIRDSSVNYRTQAIGHMSLGVKPGEVYTTYDQGSLRETGNTYDLAIQGKGFFQVNVTNKDGSVSTRYTRDGSFTITRDGFVVDADGNRLQGANGDVQVPVDAANIAIDKAGRVVADNIVVDQITLVDFADYDYLLKVGDVSYRPVDGATIIDADGQIEQGYLEMSNVQAVTEMVKLISITRAYEANQKVIQSEDAIIDKAVNSVGRI
ncbi:MAG: flagellar hook-basal body protein [Lachnospiraceae bacterium]|nr:flagellar hook-basal body protein [Lachnospiraceae bacterium]